MSKRAQPNSAGDKEVPAVRLGHPWCHPKWSTWWSHCPVETEETYLWTLCMCQVLSEMDTFRQQLPKTLAVDNPGAWDSGTKQGLSNKRMSAGEGLHGCWKSEKGECTIGKDPVTARLSYTDASQQMGILKIFSCFTFHLIWHLDSHWPSWGASGWWFTCPWLAWYCRRKTMAWHPGTAQGGRLGGG